MGFIFYNFAYMDPVTCLLYWAEVGSTAGTFFLVVFLVPVPPVLFEKSTGTAVLLFFGGTRYFLIMNQCENFYHNA